MNYHNEIVLDLPDATYHEHPALSSSGIRLLLPEYKGSPKKFQWERTHKRTSMSFDIGHAVHSKVLGIGAGIILYPEEHLTPSGNPSTRKETVAWEVEQRAAGYTIVSPDDAQRVDAMAEAALSHPTARPLFEVCGMREASVFAEIDGVPVRARFDALSGETRNGTYAVDLKTTDDATPNGFTRSVHKWGYPVQVAHYDEVHRAATGRGIDEFWLVACEKNGPFEVGVYQIEPFWIDMARKKTAAARRIFAECTASGIWPGYDEKPQTLTAPAWAVIEHEMQYESGEINV